MIELTRSIPIPKASQPNDMMFKEVLVMNMGAKVAITEIGMDSAMMKVGPGLFKKRYKTSTASNPPINPEERTSLIESLMNRD